MFATTGSGRHDVEDRTDECREVAKQRDVLGGKRRLPPAPDRDEDGMNTPVTAHDRLDEYAGLILAIWIVELGEPARIFTDG